MRKKATTLSGTSAQLRTYYRKRTIDKTIPGGHGSTSGGFYRPANNYQFLKGQRNVRLDIRRRNLGPTRVSWIAPVFIPKGESILFMASMAGQCGRQVKGQERRGVNKKLRSGLYGF